MGWGSCSGHLGGRKAEEGGEEEAGERAEEESGQGSLGGDLRRGQPVAQAEVAQRRRECRDADRLGTSHLGLAGWTQFLAFSLNFTVMIVFSLL